MGSLLAVVDQHAGGVAGVVVRLGPVLPLALIVVWVIGASAPTSERGAKRVAWGAAVVLAAAGLLHLTLVQEHLRESAAAGGFFAAAAVTQLLLAVLIWRRASARVAVAAVAVTVVLATVYVAVRLWRLPLTDGRESVDALGAIAKILEIAGAFLACAAVWGRGWFARWNVSWVEAIAVVVVGFAVSSRSVFGLGPRPAQVAVAVAAALAVAVLGRVDDRRDFALAATDVAAAALLLRSDGLAVFLVLGLVVGVLRVVVQRVDVAVPPVAIGLLVVLATDSSSRLEIFHVAHSADGAGAAVGILVASVLVLGRCRERRLDVLVAFYAAELGGQAMRLFSGRTSVTAIEVPFASLGLFLVVVVALGDSSLPLSRGAAVVAATMAGLADVVMRDAGVPYGLLIAVGGAVVMVGTVSAFDRARVNGSELIGPNDAPTGVVDANGRSTL